MLERELGATNKGLVVVEVVVEVVVVVLVEVVVEVVVVVRRKEIKMGKLLKAEVVAAVVEAQVGLGAVDVQACEVQMDELGEMGCQVAMALF